PLGGVLALVGDDPDCKSSTLPSDSAGLLRDLQIPILDPTDVGELIEFGLYGWALSRSTGCWSAMLAQTSVMDSSATIDRGGLLTPIFPSLDLDPHIRLVDTPHDQERRMARKLKLVHEFVRANPVNHVVVNPEHPDLAIVTTGKSYTNIRQALHLLGLSTIDEIRQAGIRLIKLGLLWPIDREWLRNQVEDARAALVVESKSAFLETELKTALYGYTHIPILGKEDLDGSPLLTPFGELQVDSMIDALVDVGSKLNIDIPNIGKFANRESESRRELISMNAKRKPLFCPGCPHSGSTKLPEGSRAFAGIGCHYMAQWMHRETYLFTHMGGEGANWIGQAPFTETNHVFVNLGDGTYSHSGLLAIRASVAANVNVTYKILFNDAVAMTGGQAVEGKLTVADVVAQVKAEGVREVHVVADDVRAHRGARYPVSGRSQLNLVQRRLRFIEGCTVLIVDHACANEKRRKRKRGLVPPPQRYVMINEDVCEGCGDCVAKSGCSAIKTVQTEFGEKRQIEQAHCIQDLACVEGYCPAFVEIKGSPRNRLGHAIPSKNDLPEPITRASANILIAGVGGTGVITLSQVIAVACHLDNKQVSTLDMTGLAQKGGAVISHVRIGVDHVWRTRLAQQETDVLIAADPVTATSQEVAPLLSRDRTRAVVNEVLAPSHLSVVDAGQDHGKGSVLDELSSSVVDMMTIDALKLGDEFAGTGTVANSVLLGFAYQRGLIPVSLASLQRAIELNAVAVDANLAAFNIGRQKADESTPSTKSPIATDQASGQMTLDDFIEKRVTRLNIYQNADYARTYLRWIKRIRSNDIEVPNSELSVTRFVADTLYHYMAIKDEYEVARLLTDGDFKRQVEYRFDNAEISFAFAPTWLRDPSKNKRRIGSWIRPVLKLIASLRALRGTLFDPFRFSEERKLDRRLLEALTRDIALIAGNLSESNYKTVVELLTAYRNVKGFGHVRKASWARAENTITTLRNQLLVPSEPRVLVTDQA
ncbi:MAG: indolepyruvate ferredoxin oxidoreductase family protein, partial [Gammaproteobacteria bacterium]|nr:indolepyruvate ferredoxin oxidoreductase family protein [Gammaproteobacteria bacterium]